MTKSLKLIIFSVIFLFLVYLGYSIYNTTKEGTGSFSEFDVNSTANKNIKVELVQEKGITPNKEGGVSFYVKDKNGIEMNVVLGKELPPGINDSKTVTLTGHSHGDYFHATEVEPD